MIRTPNWTEPAHPLVTFWAMCIIMSVVSRCQCGVDMFFFVKEKTYLGRRTSSLVMASKVLLNNPPQARGQQPLELSIMMKDFVKPKLARRETTHKTAASQPSLIRTAASLVNSIRLNGNCDRATAPMPGMAVTLNSPHHLLLISSYDNLILNNLSGERKCRNMISLLLGVQLRERNFPKVPSLATFASAVRNLPARIRVEHLRLQELFSTDRKRDFSKA